MRVIEQTADYTIFEGEFNGTRQIFRTWSDRVEIEFSNEFCRANGYDSIQDTIAKQPALAKQIQLLGFIPKWLTINENGTLSVATFQAN